MSTFKEQYRLSNFSSALIVNPDFHTFFFYFWTFLVDEKRNSKRKINLKYTQTTRKQQENFIVSRV